jgi:acyl carrier protein
MAFVVKLNGSNYVSERTQSTFEKALEQEIELKSQAPEKGNGSDPRPVAAQPEPTIVPEPPDYTQMLESLEQGLTHSYEHQRQTLRVHEQYLHNQEEYSKIFSQLMQQQNALFAHGNDSPERMEATLVVLEKLSRSIEQFHAHQAETLTVHNHFLSQQAEYAQAFIRLLRQQCDAALKVEQGGNGHTRRAIVTATPQTSEVEVRAREEVPEIEQAPQEVNPPAPEARAVSREASPVAPPADVEALTESLLETVSEKTGYPAEMLALEMDMEADLGIDSIKRVEILGALQEKHPELPEVETEALAELRTLEQIVEYVGRSAVEGREKAAPAPAPAPSQTPVEDAPTGEGASATGEAPADVEALTQSLLETVSEKTGYPAEMLALEMDMEADLGIDSIKRVEILGALQEKHPQLPEVETEALAELRTLEQIVAYVSREGGASKKA